MTDDTRTRINYFRSTDVERYLWEARAKAAGLTLSEFLRQAANEKVDRVRQEKRK